MRLEAFVFGINQLLVFDGLYLLYSKLNMKKGLFFSASFVILFSIHSSIYFRQRESSLLDFFSLPHSFTNSQLKASYSELLKKAHPDKSNNKKNVDAFIEIKAKYKILHDENTRLEYFRYGIVSQNIESDEKIYEIGLSLGQNVFIYVLALLYAHCFSERKEMSKTMVITGVLMILIEAYIVARPFDINFFKFFFLKNLAPFEIRDWIRLMLGPIMVLARIYSIFYNPDDIDIVKEKLDNILRNAKSIVTDSSQQIEDISETAAYSKLHYFIKLQNKGKESFIFRTVKFGFKLLIEYSLANAIQREIF